MEEAATLFKIVDSEAGKTIGFYVSDEAARVAGRRIRRDHPTLQLQLVTMDEKGMPLKFEELRGGRVPLRAGSKILRAVSHGVRPLRRAVG